MGRSSADERSQLIDILDRAQILAYPHVIGEIALGSLRQRSIILASLLGLPAARVASDEEVLDLIERDQLFSLGIGYIDAHLLTATRLTPAARLWTRDMRLHAAAQRSGVAVVDW